jgi:hypothetical protein
VAYHENRSKSAEPLENFCKLLIESGLGRSIQQDDGLLRKEQLPEYFRAHLNRGIALLLQRLKSPAVRSRFVGDKFVPRDFYMTAASV